MDMRKNNFSTGIKSKSGITCANRRALFSSGEADPHFRSADNANFRSEINFCQSTIDPLNAVKNGLHVGSMLIYAYSFPESKGSQQSTA